MGNFEEKNPEKQANKMKIVKKNVGINRENIQIFRRKKYNQTG